MKRLFTLLIILFYLTDVESQITLDTTFYDTTFRDISYIQLENSGKKLYVYKATGETIGINLYNSDYTLFKEISIDLSSLFLIHDYNSYSFAIYYIAENLFDTDGEIEFLAELSYYYEDDQTYEPYSQVLIYNEDGTILFTTDIVNTNAYLVFPSFNGNSYPGSIFNTDNSTKMFIAVYNFNSSAWSHEIYNLQGTLSTVQNQFNASNLSRSQRLKAYPNPANTHVKIDYKLIEGDDNAQLMLYNSQGMLIKTLNISTHEGKLNISTKEMPSGSYIYEVRSKRNNYGRRSIIINR